MGIETPHENQTFFHNKYGKEFTQPLTLTNFSRTQKETHYACPHCLTRINLIGQSPNLNLVSAETIDNHFEKGTSECAYYFGYLAGREIVPDTCLTCLKLLKCLIKETGGLET